MPGIETYQEDMLARKVDSKESSAVGIYQGGRYSRSEEVRWS